MGNRATKKEPISKYESTPKKAEKKPKNPHKPINLMIHPGVGQRMDVDAYVKLFDKRYAEYKKMTFEKQSRESLGLELLKKILYDCVKLSEHEILEFYCIQEISLVEYWKREDFKKAILESCHPPFLLSHLPITLAPLAIHPILKSLFNYRC